jgi:hypothetical protein
MEIPEKWKKVFQNKVFVTTLVFFVLAMIGGSVIFVMARNGDKVQDEKIVTKKENLEKEVDLDKMNEAEKMPEDISPLSGLQCEGYDNRPIAVMLASDKAARPLSSISKADMVFEMPVITGSVTRLMGVYVCERPTEVGSIRSARHDYISLVRGLDAIFVHWGGSHFALDEIKSGVRYTGENLGKIDDVDALGTSGPFFRKSHVPAPHNGFVSLPRVEEIATQRGYKLKGTSFEGYDFMTPSEIDKAKQDTKATLSLGFGGGGAVKWEYDPESNKFTRYWAGILDKDFATNETINTSNIVVMQVGSVQIEGQYNTVYIYGEGEAKFYMNGKELKGKWKKDGFKGALLFEDEEGNPLKLVPGQTFVEILEPGQEVKWSTS